MTEVKAQWGSLNLPVPPRTEMFNKTMGQGFHPVYGFAGMAEQQHAAASTREEFMWTSPAWEFIIGLEAE